MQLEDYFDFLSPNDIRIKGHRIGIESVVYEYLSREQTPGELARRFPTLTQEQIYATILFYLQNSERIDAYISDWLEFGRRAREEQERNPPLVVVRLREMKAQQEKATTAA